MNTDDIIKEIEDIRERVEFEGSYLSAIVEWLDINGIPINEREVKKHVPSVIMQKLRDEAYENYLIKPSHNPKLKNGISNDVFLDLFF